MTACELAAFEHDIAKEYSVGNIKAPVHLRSGREEELIDVFKRHDISLCDWVFGYWDSHELALLKGVPKERVKSEIMAGRSIALCFSDYNFICSGIVGSLCGVAVGVAWVLKKVGSKARVFHFCGDMSAETGIFHEAVKFAQNHDLPVMFIVSDNGLSVHTDTEYAWGLNNPHTGKVERFRYKNGYPHSGIGKVVAF